MEHRFRRKYCPVCGYTSIHEDNECLDESHNDRIRRMIESLPLEEKIEMIEEHGFEHEYDVEAMKEEAK